MNLPGFEMIDRVGEGSMAVVWKAHQTSLERTVAIKVLKRQFAGDEREVHDFIQEARAAAQIKHPNIVQVYDVASEGGVFYIVMEYVDGAPLGETIEARGPIPAKDALKTAIRVAEALNKAWTDSRIIHRDIKPDNILIDADGTVKVADLGLARIVDTAGAPGDSAATDFIVGTPHYMAPEQVKAVPDLDCRADMYSLGATLYHMVTGKMPFAGNEIRTVMRMQLDGHLTNPRNLNPEVSLGLAQLIARLMMKDPARRFADWNDALKTMKKVAAGGMILGKAGDETHSTISALRTGDENQAPGAGSPAPAMTRPYTDAPRRVPRFVRAPLWIALVLWLAGLAYYRLSQVSAPEAPAEQPPPPPASRPATPEPAAATTPATPTDTTITRVVTPARHTVHLPPEAPVLVKQLQADREAVVDVPAYEPPVMTEMTDAERQVYNELVKNVATRLMAGDNAGARAAIAAVLRKPSSRFFAKEALRLQAFNEQVIGLDAIVGNAFRNRIGEETDIFYKGRPRDILLQAMSGDKVHGVLIERTPDGVTSNEVLLAISALDPIERSRWIGTADSPAKCAMKFLLYFERGDYQTAMRFAPHCGPFKDVFAEQAGQRLISTRGARGANS